MESRYKIDFVHIDKYLVIDLKRESLSQVIATCTNWETAQKVLDALILYDTALAIRNNPMSLLSPEDI